MYALCLADSVAFGECVLAGDGFVYGAGELADAGHDVPVRVVAIGCVFDAAVGDRDGAGADR